MSDRDETVDIREDNRLRDSAGVQRADATPRADDETDLGTALEGRPQGTVAGGPGGGNTVGAGRGEPELGNMGNIGTPPDNTGGSQAGLGAGRGDLGGGGGLGDDLGDLADDRPGAAPPDGGKDAT